MNSDDKYFWEEPRQDRLVGSELREMRELEGVTQKELAEKIGMSAQHLSDIENGRRRVTRKQAEAFDRELAGIDSEWIDVTLGRIPSRMITEDVTEETLLLIDLAFRGRR